VIAFQERRRTQEVSPGILLRRKGEVVAQKKKEPKKKKELVPYRGGGFGGVFDEMDRLFDRYVRGWGFGPSRLPRVRWPEFRWPEGFEMLSPHVDVYEDGKQVVLTAEIPGVRKEDLDIDVSEHAVTIRGEKKEEEEKEKKDYYRVERSYGSFSRTVPIPPGADHSRAKASFRDGVLEIRVPKKPEARKKKIKVTVE
jgi:HSP20 family protein